VLFGYANCAPENAAQAQAKLRAAFDGWIAEGPTAEELAEGRQAYTRAFEGRMADDRFVCRLLLDGLENGRTLAYQRELLERIEAVTQEEVARALEDGEGGGS
jgi:zinc protease